LGRSGKEVEVGALMMRRIISVLVVIALLMVVVMLFTGLASAQGQSATAPHGEKGTGEAMLKVKDIEGEEKLRAIDEAFRDPTEPPGKPLD
jgi:hypothetical protein